ncbi:uncharacterized protein NMK_2581 [Novimethylophilus kurashikiensis]|uniref:Transferase n=1 Tax=Novimethylophilus kurashikiensis TaxID=1825523 RepID=A0A2R5F9S0_9PROT|nr:glycosyltransferase family 4 protein [Novimethylophilus kurashikiensis]GBG14980.1 uncharacterized protein NMK_2581 [Novimethylophilus kurashikiensis]
MKSAFQAETHGIVSTTPKPRTKPLRVLVVHNQYQQAGGEDAVVKDECALLEKNGVSVKLYRQHNRQIEDMPRLQVALDTIWSQRTVAEIGDLCERFRPDVIHAHNTFPLISPSLYFAAREHHVPVVQTLHNFRLFCAQAMFLRDGKICEDCIGTVPWRGVLHRCYRNSAVQSAVVVGMQGIHRALGSYRREVTRYIALNQFCRDKFIQAGLPGERISIKPNFVDLPPPSWQQRHGALFVGRLSQEKGISTLGEAAMLYPEAQLTVIGTGPEQPLIQGRRNIRLMGWQQPPAITQHMQQAAYLVMPSLWYENFPRTLVEAYACGLPVIASRLGAMAELVKDGVTGLLFDPGDANDLVKKMRWADSQPEAIQRMGWAARQEYEQKFTPETNFSQLMGIYGEAIRDRMGERE